VRDFGAVRQRLVPLLDARLDGDVMG